MKQTVSILLLIALLCGTISCSNGGASSDTTVNTDDTTTTSGETEAKRRMPDVESCDYGGEPFNILAPEWGLYEDFYHAEEQAGDAMSDALYERNRMVEEYLGVDVSYICQNGINDIQTAVQKQVMSGDDTYQLVLTHCITHLSNMVTSNLLYDWNELPNVDLTREYWNQSIMEHLSLYGKTYYAVSDYMYAMPYCVLFNADLLEEYDLENPYDLVRSGDWTLEKLIEMAGAVTKDLDGNSVMDEKDQYGWTSYGDSTMNSLFYASNIYLTTPTEDGGLALSLNSDRTVRLIELWDQLVNKSGDAWIRDSKDTKVIDFKDGRSLFTFYPTYDLDETREWTIDFGILPYPKLDAEQEEYISNDWGGMMCIPSTVSNPDMIGKVCEMFAYYSSDTTLPAYYNVMMGEKFARDEDAREMLELIFSNVVYDAGYNYFGFAENLGDLFYTITRLVWRDGSDSFASWYEKRAAGAEKVIQNFLDSLKEE